VLTNKPEKNEILINLPILTSWRVHLKYLNEVFKGRYHEQPKVTSFPND